METNSGKACREKIAVWGVGDWGVRMLDAINPELRRRVTTVALNSDLQSLICSSAHQKLQIGKKLTGGQGTGGEREIGEAAFRESQAAIQKTLAGTEALIAVTGLGGGIGTGVTPWLCHLAREEGIFALAIITRPFEFEGKKKAVFSQEGREEIKKSGACPVCFHLDRFLGRLDENTPYGEAFHYCDLLLQEAIESLIAYLTTPVPQGGDYGILKNIFASGAECVFGRHEENETQNLVAAMKGALSNLFLTAQELSLARGCLIQIRSGKVVQIGRVRQAICSVAEMLGEKVSLVYSVQQEPELGEKVKVAILVSGVPGRERVDQISGLPVTLRADFHPPKQTEMDFQKAARGRFSEMEPTLMEGEDLDIPTYLRKGEKLV